MFPKIIILAPVSVTAFGFAVGFGFGFDRVCLWTALAVSALQRIVIQGLNRQLPGMLYQQCAMLCCNIVLLHHLVMTAEGIMFASVFHAVKWFLLVKWSTMPFRKMGGLFLVLLRTLRKFDKGYPCGCLCPSSMTGWSLLVYLLSFLQK